MDGLINSRGLSLAIDTSRYLLAITLVTRTAWPHTPAAAQILSTGDETHTIITTEGNLINIEGGQLSSDQTNLFHSFEQFDLSDSQTANFEASANVDNIIGKINTAQHSSIDGTLQISGSEANLYLMNPAGILLGPNAQLNLGGSFTATTATSIGFGTNNLNVTSSTDYINLNGNPTHFQFNAVGSGNLLNLGNLTVEENQSIHLMGNTVINSGQLQAPSGNITITAVENSSLVRIHQADQLLSLEIDSGNLTSSSLTQQNQTILPTQLGEMLTGSALNQANRLKIQTDGSVLLENTEIDERGGNIYLSGSLSTVGAQIGGEVNIFGDRITLTNANIDASGNNQGGLIRIGGDTRGQGDFITATNTLVDGGSSLIANATEAGNGGRIIVWGNEQTDFFGNVSAQGGQFGGDGGFAEVSGMRSLIFNGSADLSASQGGFGILLLDPENVEITDGIIEDITATYFSSSDIETLFNTTNLVIEASNNIRIHDITDNQLTTQPGRDVTFSADADGSMNGRFHMETDITIFAEQGDVSISGADIVAGHINTSTTVPRTNGGSVTLESSQGISVESITTSSSSDQNNSGTAGDIELTAASGDVVIHGDLDAQSQVSKNNAESGGNITVESGGDIMAQNISTVSATGNNNPNTGGAVTLLAHGNITTQSIDTRSVAGRNGQQIGGTVLLSSAERGISTAGITTAGGSVDLSAPENISVDFIDASGGNNSAPTSINLSTQENITVTGNIPTRSETISLSTAETIAGDINIEYGNNSTTPFVVGSTSENGAIGSLETPTTLITSGSFINSTPQGNITFGEPEPPVTVPEVASPVVEEPSDIQEPPVTDLEIESPVVEGPPILEESPVTAPEVASPVVEAELELTQSVDTQPLNRQASETELNSISVDVRALSNNIENRQGETTESNASASVRNSLLTTADSTSAEATLETTETNISSGFQAYLGLSAQEEPKSAIIADIQKTLAQIQEETGETPAMIYAYFVPSVGESSHEAFSSSDRTSSSAENSTESSPTLIARPDDELEIMMITPDRRPVSRRQSGVTREQVEQVGYNFRQQIMNPFSSRQQYLSSAQQMHDFLVSPVSAFLEEEEIDSLGFVLETGLRTIPLAALHDGKQYLVEHYSLGLLPSFTLTDFSRDRNHTYHFNTSRVLAMGASDFENQPDLPAVKAEINLITEEIWRGDAFLNETFDLETIQAQLQTKAHEVFHLATHAVFQAGDTDQSYLQLWNDQLALSDIGTLQLSDSDIRMIILSACNTAMGDEASEYGFAGFSVQAGIPSALASLWPVSDEGTLGFMTQFYQELDEAPVRSEALRAAQISMINGAVGIRHGEIYGPENEILTTIPELAESGQWDFSHPFYWSPFTMIGNPW